MDAAIPASKGKLTEAVAAFLRQTYNDPVVEVHEVKPNFIRIRVSQDRGGPRYYNIKISQEI